MTPKRFEVHPLHRTEFRDYQPLLFAVPPALFVTIFLVVPVLLDVEIVLFFQVGVVGHEDGSPFFIQTS